MEQIQELFEILKQTPEMALWGMVIYFAFILAKLASWVLALKVIFQMLITRFFNYKDESLKISKGAQIVEFFEDKKVTSVDHSSLLELLQAIKDGNVYIHSSNIEQAIKAIKKSRTENK